MLELQKRLTEISRRRIFSDLADAQTSEEQSRDLAIRTSSMASDYARTDAMGRANELCDRMRFAAALTIIANDADQSAIRSQNERDEIASRMADFDQKLERISEHLTDEKRETDRKTQLRENTDDPAMARNLLKLRHNRPD